MLGLCEAGLRIEPTEYLVGQHTLNWTTETGRTSWWEAGEESGSRMGNSVQNPEAPREVTGLPTGTRLKQLLSRRAKKQPR